MLWLWLLGAKAYAGSVVVGLFAGADLPVDANIGKGEAGSSSSPGLAVQGIVGWRQKSALVDIQPELVVHQNVSNQVALYGAGLAATVLKPVGLGAYAHVGLPAYEGPAFDAGGILEIKVHKKVRPSARAGYARAQIPHAKCGNCAQPSDHFFSASVGVTLGF